MRQPGGHETARRYKTARQARDRQADTRETGGHKTGGHKTDRRTRERQVDMRETGRHERDRWTRERQADTRQPGGHEPASLENSKAQIPQNKLGKGQPTGKERPVSFLMFFYLSLENERTAQL